MPRCAALLDRRAPLLAYATSILKNSPEAMKIFELCVNSEHHDPVPTGLLSYPDGSSTRCSNIQIAVQSNQDLVLHYAHSKIKDFEEIALKQAGAELCQAQHSLSLDLDTN